MPQPQVFWQTEDPTSSLGSNGDICMQTQSDDRIATFKKIAGRWTSLNIGAPPATNLNIYTFNKDLTDAQIKALPSTAVQIAPAPGANIILVPTFCFMHLNWAADYDNIGSTSSISIQYESGQTVLAPLVEEASGQVSNLLIDGASHSAFMPIAGRAYDAGFGILRFSGVGQYNDDPAPINSIVKILAVNSGTHTGDFTMGDPANSLSVALVCHKFNIITGAFV